MLRMRTYFQALGLCLCLVSAQFGQNRAEPIYD